MKNLTTYTLITLSWVLLVVGCNSEKRALRHIHKAERINSEIPAKYCAEKYPPIDSINERTIFIPGETITDTVETTNLEIIQDTVFITKIKTITVTKHDTVRQVKYEKVVDRAKETALQSDLRQATDNAVKYKQQRNIYGAIAIGLALFILIPWVIKRFVK